MHNTAIRRLRIFLITIGVLFLALYAYNQASLFISGPSLIIENPPNNLETQEKLITVSGSTKNASKITLNGKDIFINEAGAFTEELLLTTGYTILEVAVTDRFGRSVAETRNIILTE